MKINKFGEFIYDENDMCDLLMQGHDISRLRNVTIDSNLNVEYLSGLIDDSESMLTWKPPQDDSDSVKEFDKLNQSSWFMPEQYKNMDIAEHVLSLCNSQQELQRCGQELIEFQNRNLFDLLRYMKYLVDVMQQHKIIWGVGRGSSVASYVLYKLGVHRIDSLYYDLDLNEFLR